MRKRVPVPPQDVIDHGAEVVSAVTITAPQPIPTSLARRTDVVAGGGALLPADEFAAGLRTYWETRDVLLRSIMERMVAGIDWQTIHRSVGRGEGRKDCENKYDLSLRECAICHGKPMLTKAGAEKVCGLLRVRQTFTRDEQVLEMAGKSREGTIALICHLVSVDTGEIAAEGRGARSVEKDYGDVNKSVKMAQKSAMEDAVLRMAGLSEIFSQEYDPNENRFRAPVKLDRKGAAKADAKISPAQLTRLHALGSAAEKRGAITRADIVIYLKRLGYDSSKEIRVKDYEPICAAIERDLAGEPDETGTVR